MNFDAFAKNIRLSLVEEGEVKYIKKGDRIYFYQPDKQAKDLTMHVSDKLQKFIDRL